MSQPEYGKAGLTVRHSRYLPGAVEVYIDCALVCKDIAGQALPGVMVRNCSIAVILPPQVSYQTGR